VGFYDLKKKQKTAVRKTLLFKLLYGKDNFIVLLIHKVSILIPFQIVWIIVNKKLRLSILSANYVFLKNQLPSDYSSDYKREQLNIEF
jgi:hypothetical protein